jgi:hypothetical protein
MKDEIYRLCGLLEAKPDSSDQELKQAHRDLVKVWHPDRFPEDERLRRKAEDKIKTINAAYEALLSMGEELRAESIRPRASSARAASARPASPSPLRTPPPASSGPGEETASSQAASPPPNPAAAPSFALWRRPLPPYVKPLVLVGLCLVLIWVWPRSSSEPPKAPPPPAPAAASSNARAHDASVAMVKTEQKPAAPSPAVTLPEATLKSRTAAPKKDLPECKNGDDVPFAHRLSNGAFAHTHPSCWRVSQYSAEELEGFVRTAALQYEIPEELIRSVIAVSQKLSETDETTAQGLMQLTAPVAKEMLVRDPLDARQSIDGGARFLRILANQHEGNMEKILTLYRAGHPTTEKAEMDALLQEPDTQTFVKNVIRVYFDLKQNEEAK